MTAQPFLLLSPSVASHCAVPDTIGELKQLKVLSLNGCSSLECLPDSIAELTKLENLNVRGCTSLVAPASDGSQQLTR